MTAGTDLSSAGPEGAPGRPSGAVRLPPGPQRYEAVLDSLAEVVFQTDAHGNWTYLNQAWTEITGFSVEQTIGHNFLEYVHPDEVQETIHLFETVVSRRLGHCHHETRYRTAGGAYRWVELRASVLYDENGAVVGNAGTIIDIAQRRAAQERLADEAAVLDLLARGVALDETLGALAAMMARHSGVKVTVDVDTPTARASATAAPESGTPQPSLDPPDRVVVAIVSPREGTHLGTFTFHRTAGRPSSTTLDRDLLERGSRLVTIAVERENAKEAARQQALHDPLTGLPNRALLTDRLEQALRAARARNRRMALLLLDLNHFKVINDTLGHEAGDRVLKLLASRLRGPLRDADTAGRTGGDEFLIVLPEVTRHTDAEQVARRIRTEVRQPVRLDDPDIELQVDVSIGVAVTSGHIDSRELLRRADVAMYRAKHLGGGHAVYDEAHDVERLRASRLAGDLRLALANEDLAVHYQPKVDLRTGAVVGVESLVRWHHPVLGGIPPAEFIPLAERTGAIKVLSLWVLREALGQVRRWRDMGLDVPVAVNLSARLLHDPELAALVHDLLDAEQLPGEGLELEITESAVMADPEGAASAISLLSDAGVAFAIDDFGVGYSSLSYLKRLPVQAIKIDKSFVRDMLTDTRDATIVGSAIRLAHDFDIVVVAEGVETAGVRDLLVELGCDQVQGFHIAAPMPGASLEEWLRDKV